MISPNLMLLGIPHAILSEPAEATVRFRYRDTWLLLASLVLDPDCTSRERLIVRMGLDRDGNSGRAALRLRIDDLRHGARTARSHSAATGLGPENVHADRDTVAVNPNLFRTDVDVLRATAAALPDLTDPVDVLARVESLGPLMGGRFLEGLERGGSVDDWLLRIRRETDAAVARLWTAAGIALRDLGKRSDAHDAFRRAYERFPENIDLIGELLETVGDHNASWLGIHSAPLDTVVTLLPMETAKTGSLSVGETAVLKAAVQERLSQLSRSTVNVIEKLAHLPVALPVETVEQWMEIEPADLERAVDAFPVVLKDSELRLHTDIARIVRDLCPPERSDAIQREMIRRIESAWVDTLSPGAFELAPELAIQILEWVVQNDFPLNVSLVRNSLAFARSFRTRPPARDFARYLENTVPAGPDRDVTIVNMRMAHHIHADRFTDALDAGLQFLGKHGAHEMLQWYYLLLSAHHGENDASFDELTVRSLDSLKAHDLHSTPVHRARLAEIHALIAENRLARGMFKQADLHNRRAIEYAVGSQGQVGPLSRMLSQQAQIDAAAGLPYADVARSWEKALTSFQKDGNREGEAECLRALGQLASSQGLHAVGKTLIERAVELFRAVDKPDAVNATEGALAAVLAAAGEAEVALAILTRCVGYWRAKGHARWTAHFESERQRVWEMAAVDDP